MADIPTLMQLRTSIAPTGDVVVEFGYALTPFDATMGHIQWFQLAMTATQALQVADDIRATAAHSRQSDQTGQA